MGIPEANREVTRGMRRTAGDAVCSVAGAALFFGSVDFLFGLNAGGWSSAADAKDLWRGYATSGVFFLMIAAVAGLAAWGSDAVRGCGGTNGEARRVAMWVGLLSALGCGAALVALRGADPALARTALFLGGLGAGVSAAAAVALDAGGRSAKTDAAARVKRLDLLFTSAPFGAAAAGLIAGARMSGILGEVGTIPMSVLGVLFVAVTGATALALRTRAAAGIRWGRALVLFGLVLSGAWPRADEEAKVERGEPAAVSGPGRIVLITIDTLRADALGCYGPGGGPSPNIDVLASRGMRFGNATSPAPWTLPSFASMMTGTPVALHQTTARQAALPDGLTTLAERLREAGYATAGFGSNYFLRKDRGFGRGFDEFRFYPRLVDLIDAPMDQSIGAKLYNAMITLDAFKDVSSTQIAEMAIDWIGSQEGPYFLWVHFFDPHGPYAPPEAFWPSGEPAPRLGYEADVVGPYREGKFEPTEEEKAWLRALYQGEVRYVDAEVGRVLAALDATGSREETLIVLTSDHGEEFWDHGDFEHGHTLYQELIHVPLIISRPGVLPTGVRDDRVSLTALHATVLELAGLEVREPADDQPLIRRNGEDALYEGTIFAAGTTLSLPQEAAIREGWKLSQVMGGDAAKLFDLEGDPQERTNVSSQEAPRVDALRRELAGWYQQAEAIREAGALETGGTIEVPEYVLDDLEDLGYLN